jgi:hypothetical protein
VWMHNRTLPRTKSDDDLRKSRRFSTGSISTPPRQRRPVGNLPPTSELPEG